MRHELDREKKTLRVIFPGDVLSTNVETLRNEVLAVIETQAPAAGWDCAEMDLNAAQMIDSVGLNLLVSLIKTLRGRGKSMRIRIASAHIKRALKFTRLDQLAEVVGA